MILILNVMVEVTIGGDQSVDRNGGTEGKHSTHLNMDQSSGFEHPAVVLWKVVGGCVWKE